jgi:hypothetical protein
MVLEKTTADLFKQVTGLNKPFKYYTSIHAFSQWIIMLISVSRVSSIKCYGKYFQHKNKYNILNDLILINSQKVLQAPVKHC